MIIYIVWNTYNRTILKIYQTKQLAEQFAEQFLVLHPRFNKEYVKVVGYTVETSLHEKRIRELDEERAQLCAEEME